MTSQMFFRSCSRLLSLPKSNIPLNTLGGFVPQVDFITKNAVIRSHHTTASLCQRFSDQGQRRRKEPEDDCPGYVIPYNKETEDLVDQLLLEMKDDMPLPNMPDPFEKNYRRCFLCRHDIELDHKNVRLLSQFVSPYTGRIYGRAVTGLCIPMQREVSKCIKRSRYTGYMPYVIKDPKYLKDPQPFDPMRKV